MTTEPGRQHRFRAASGATELLLVRHGESRGPVGDEAMPRLGEQADPPLHAVGEQEAQLVGERLRDEAIDAIYTSPLQRCRQTASPLVAATGLEPVVLDDLREVYLGDIDGLNLALLVSTDDTVRRALKEERWDLLPGAEPLVAYAARVRSAIDGIAERHPDGRVVVFTHGGVIGQVVAEASGSRAHAFIGAENASITHLVVSGRRWAVRTFNDATHLRARLFTSSPAAAAG